MKYSVIFGLMGVIICYLSVTLGGWWYLFLWLGISFFTLSVGYAGIGPRVFCKQPEGTIPLWVKIIHFPFLLYSTIIWHIARILSRENPFDRLGDDLILGRRLFASELPSGVDNYVDLTAEFEDPKKIRKTINYHCLPILDGSVPLKEELTSMVSRIRTGTTYIHCAQGHGRTGLFTLALLSTRGKIDSFEEGLSLLKKARPGIGLNKTQETFIRKFIAEQQDATESGNPRN
jgi:protein-tyrosine phosphatase